MFKQLLVETSSNSATPTLTPAATVVASATPTPTPTATPFHIYMEHEPFWNSSLGILIVLAVVLAVGLLVGFAVQKGGSSSFLEKLFANFTDMLAYWVVILAFVGILGLSYVVLSAKNDLDTAKYIFAAVLPLLGTWVGTVLAHYFQKENLAAATQSITNLASKVAASDKLQSVPVKTVMIRPDRIKSLAEKKDDKDIKLPEFAKYMRDNGVDRMPIFKGNELKGPIGRVVHVSLIDKFIAQKTTPGQPAPDLSLADLTADPQLGTVIRGSFAVVKGDATLADAKNAMDKASNALGSAGNCYDVFVTDSGSSDDPIIGWITNDIINENAKV